MDSNGLILLHGWGMRPGVFAPLCERLPAGRQTLVPALPGYPGSDWPAGMAFDRQLDLMGASLPPGELAGWSLGGLYAIGLAHRFPERFSRISLIACNPCFVKRDDWACALDATVVDGFYSELMRDSQRTVRRFLALQMQGETHARDLVRDLSRQLTRGPAPNTDVLCSGLEQLRQLDLRTALGELKQPRRLLLGQRDRLVPFRLARQIADVTPRIQVESVAGAAHAPILSHPGEVAKWLDDDRPQ